MPCKKPGRLNSALFNRVSALLETKVKLRGFSDSQKPSTPRALRILISDSSTPKKGSRFQGLGRFSAISAGNSANLSEFQTFQSPAFAPQRTSKD